MASIVELAELAKSSYGTSSSCFVEMNSGSVVWNRIHDWPFGPFYAAMYQKPDGGAPVLAFRGTDDLFDGAVDDLGLALTSELTPQMAMAMSVAQRATSFGKFYVTGHSLGGALAVMVGAYQNRPGVTFNAPGVMDTCLRNVVSDANFIDAFARVGRCVAGSRILNIRINADPVSSMFTTGGRAGGDVRTFSAPQCGINVLCRHGIDTCVTAVRTQPQNFLDLGWT